MPSPSDVRELFDFIQRALVGTRTRVDLSITFGQAPTASGELTEDSSSIYNPTGFVGAQVTTCLEGVPPGHFHVVSEPVQFQFWPEQIEVRVVERGEAFSQASKWNLAEHLKVRSVFFGDVPVLTFDTPIEFGLLAHISQKALTRRKVEPGLKITVVMVWDELLASAPDLKLLMVAYGKRPDQAG